MRFAHAVAAPNALLARIVDGLSFPRDERCLQVVTPCAKVNRHVPTELGLAGDRRRRPSGHRDVEAIRPAQAWLDDDAVRWLALVRPAPAHHCQANVGNGLRVEGERDEVLVRRGEESGEAACQGTGKDFLHAAGVTWPNHAEINDSAVAVPRHGPGMPRQEAAEAVAFRNLDHNGRSVW